MRGKMRGLTDRRVVHVQIATDRADDNVTRVKPDADLDVDTMRPSHAFGVILSRFLHPESGVTRHNPVAHDLVHRGEPPLSSVQGRHRKRLSALAAEAATTEVVGMAARTL